MEEQLEYIKTIPEMLHSMGYRGMKPNLFGKPIAYSIFLVEIKEDSIKWSNRCKLNENEMQIWNSEIINKDEFTIDFLKDCENETDIRFHGNDTFFEFGF